MTNFINAPTHLLCVLGPLTLGFEALHVREVMALPLVTPISEAAPLVAGAVNLRGRVVPLLDLRAALGLEITPPTARESLIVLENEEQIVAVRVDEVHDVQQLESSSARNGDEGASAATFVAGLARSATHIVQLLNLPALFEAAAAPPHVLQFDAQTGNGRANWRAPWFVSLDDDREILAARAQNLARPLEIANSASMNISAPDNAHTLPLAAAMLNGELFGFDLNMVREFAPLRSLTRIPLGPEAVLGLLNLRGEILPLLDIRPALGMKTSTAPNSSALMNNDGSSSQMEVVVIEHEQQRAAIWVEQVLDVFTADSGRFRAATSGELLNGSVPYGARMLAVLNVPAILSELARAA